MLDLVPISDGLAGGQWPVRVFHRAQHTALVQRDTYARMRTAAQGLQDIQDEPAGAWPVMAWTPPHPMALDALTAAQLIQQTTDWEPARNASELGIPPPELFEHARLVAAKLNTQLGRDLSGPGSGQILRYLPGDWFDWHADRTPFSEPHCRFEMSVIVQLSHPDAYEGGLVHIETDSGIYQMPTIPGTVAVFPAETKHKVSPLTSGERFSAVVFFESAPNETTPQ